MDKHDIYDLLYVNNAPREVLNWVEQSPLSLMVKPLTLTEELTHDMYDARADSLRGERDTLQRELDAALEHIKVLTRQSKTMEATYYNTVAELDAIKESLQYDNMMAVRQMYTDACLENARLRDSLTKLGWKDAS